MRFKHCCSVRRQIDREKGTFEASFINEIDLQHQAKYIGIGIRYEPTATVTATTTTTATTAKQQQRQKSVDRMQMRDIMLDDGRFSSNNYSLILKLELGRTGCYRLEPCHYAIVVPEKRSGNYSVGRSAVLEVIALARSLLRALHGKTGHFRRRSTHSRG